MSLARAFTTRRNKPDMHISPSNMLGRSASQRGGKPVNRLQISGPVSLVSTSNASLNNAQAIPGTRPIQQQRNFSGSSAISSSGEDSDTSMVSLQSGATSLTDASSIGDTSPITPEPNHLSCYFNPGVDTETKSHTQARSPSANSMATPKLPQRVPSHSKRAHESVARSRSIRRMMSPAPSSGDFSRSSTEMIGSSTSSMVEAPKENPFGSELAQLDEVAEEFGHVVRNAEADADAVVLESHDLAIFSAADYLSEIQALIYQAFATEEPTSWI